MKHGTKENMFVVVAVMSYETETTLDAVVIVRSWSCEVS